MMQKSNNFDKVSILADLLTMVWIEYGSIPNTHLFQQEMTIFLEPCCVNVELEYTTWGEPYVAGFKLAIQNSQFAKRFGSLWMSFCVFSKVCKSLKSDTSWIFRVIHWTSYIVSYFKPIKYLLVNNNVISQRFIVYNSPNKFAKLS